MISGKNCQEKSIKPCVKGADQRLSKWIGPALDQTKYSKHLTTQKLEQYKGYMVSFDKATQKNLLL